MRCGGSQGAPAWTEFSGYECILRPPRQQAGSDERQRAAVDSLAPARLALRAAFGSLTRPFRRASGVRVCDFLSRCHLDTAEVPFTEGSLAAHVWGKWPPKKSRKSLSKTGGWCGLGMPNHAWTGSL